MIVPRSQRESFVFVDTSAFYALLDRSDRWHTEARRSFEGLARERRPLFTSNLVVAETYVLTRHTLGHAVAVSWLESLDLNLVFQEESDHERVSRILARYGDKDFSYTDAASFILMERLGIPVALTFDDHFRQYGISVLT